MKKHLLITFLLAFITCSVTCQTQEIQKLNLGMEEIDTTTTRPTGWKKWGYDDYFVEYDSVVAHSGKYSLRIEATDKALESSFGSSAYAIPAIYKGTWIELSGYMKIENVKDGFAGLLLRIDGEGEILEFDNMQNKNITGTHDWLQYKITLPYHNDAKNIMVAGILTGKGKIWLDDYEVFIDGKPLKEVPLKKEEQYKASLDSEFVNGSAIESIEMRGKIIENLAILGKVWGFLKYYHPVVATGDYNWDFELFRIFPKIIKSKDKNERNSILTNWINSLGEIKGEQKLEIYKENTKLLPDLKWIEDTTQFEKDLIALLEKVKNAPRKGFNYYVDFVPSIDNPKFNHESDYANLKNIDAGYRLLALYRYWNIIQYFSPYRHLTDDNWNDILPEFIPKLINNKNDCEYKITILELVNRLHDTHANIWSNEKCINDLKGSFYAPVQAKFIEDKYVVTGYLNDSLGKNSGLEIGDVILKVDGNTIEELIKEKKQFYPASNHSTKLRDMASDLLRSKKSKIEITYEHNEKYVTKEVVLNESVDLKYKLLFSRTDTCWKFIDKEIGYIYPGTIKSELIPEIMTAFAQTKGIIIDMRCYPSEFIVFSLGSYLLPEETEFVKFTKGNIKFPGLFTFTEPTSLGSYNQYYYKGKIVILVNEITQSSAEYTTMAFWSAPYSMVIGSTTAGADGNVSKFNIPGGISTMISGIGVYYPDGGETQRVGILPDVFIKPTIKGTIEGRDEVLEKAIEIIK